MFKKPTFVFNTIAGSIGLAIFILIIYRAATLSITIDESATTILLSATFWETMFAPQYFQSANNHILNSLLMKLSYHCFGSSELALRLPNVLAYLMYFSGSLIIARETSDKLHTRICTFILFNGVLYLIDFFSMIRGYGLALGFQMLSLSLMVLYLKGGTKKYMVWSFVLASLAVYSNFTWLNYMMPLWAAYNLYLLIEHRASMKFWQQLIRFNVVPFICVLGLFFLSYTPISYLRKNNEFKWGESSLTDSLRILTHDFLNQNESISTSILFYLILLICIISLVMLVRAISQPTYLNINKYLVFGSSLLLIIILLALFQRHAMHVMYMSGRKALLLFPIFILLGSLLLIHLSTYSTLLSKLLTGLLSAYLIFHFTYKINIHAVREWYFDENSKEVVYYINKHPLSRNKRTAVSWYFYGAFCFYNSFRFDDSFQNISKLEERTNPDEYAYYYVMTDDIAQVPINYKPLYRLSWDRILFVKDNAYFQRKRNALLSTLHHWMKADDATIIQKADSILMNERLRPQVEGLIPIYNGDLK